MSQLLSEETRKELFRTLVNNQDQGSNVETSRQRIAAQFGTAVEEVRRIEREGISKQWLPL
jgi:hypothetical protein